MLQHNDSDVKISVGGSSKRLRLLLGEAGKSWVKREEPVTPRVSDNAATLETTSLPPDRALAFAMDDWHWGMGLTEFGLDPSEPGHVARYQDGRDMDTSEPGRVRHGPKAVDTEAVTGTVIDMVKFEGSIYLLTNTRIYSYTGTTLTEEDATGGGNFERFEPFGGNLYVAAGTQYFSWNGTTLTEVTDTGPTSLPAQTFVRLDNVMWRSHGGNLITRSTNPGDGTEWLSPDIVVGDGDEAIKNMFVISGLLFVATESTIYAVDADDVPHEINKRLRNENNSGAAAFKMESGGDAWLVNKNIAGGQRGSNVLRILAEGFEEFRMFRAGPYAGTPRRPIDFFPLSQNGGVSADFDNVFLRISRNDTGSSNEVTIMKGVERGGDEYSWSPLLMYTDTAGFSAKPILVSGDKIYTVDDTLLRVYGSHTWANYADDWILDTPYYNANFPTWDKIWFRLEVIAELVGLGTGTTATMDVLYRKDDETVFTLIGTAKANGKTTLSLPGTDQLASQRIQLRFQGKNANSDQNGIDLLAFSLEGAIRPEATPLFDFTVLARTDSEAAFIEGLRTKTSQIALTDPWGKEVKIFVLPGFPVQGIATDSALQGPQRVYRVVAQQTPPTS